MKNSHARRLACSLAPFLIAAASLYTLSGCSPRNRAQPLSRVRIAVPLSPITYLPVYLARELGYYKEQGVDVELQDFPGGSKALEAMFGGSADVCACVYELAIQLTSEGRHVQSFLTILERPGLVLAVSPSSKRHIRQVEDLKGSVVGISTPGSASHLFLNYLLRRHQVRLQDVSVSSIGLGALSIAAFKQGRVDAAVLAGSAITAAQHRVPTLFVVADARTAEGVRQIYGMDVYPAHDLLAQTEWLRNNPENARKLAAAVMKSMRYMKEHSPEEIHRHMPAQYRIQEEGVDLDALRATVPMISQDGKVTAEEARAIKNVLAVSSEKVRNARIDLEGTYTNEYLPSTFPTQTR